MERSRLPPSTASTLVPGAPLPFLRMPRLPVLDGWRAISIAAVLMCHMLPLGPSRLRLNVAFGYFGMALFFSLSGFLIASTLFFNPSISNFAIRRILRIVPVAWLFLLLVLPFAGAGAAMWRADLLFYTNLPPYHLMPITGHLWSLCVEVQFYAFIAVFVFLFRSRALAFLPLVCVAVTLNRILTHHTADIDTLYRVDEILSGASLAYFFHSVRYHRLRTLLSRVSPIVPLALLCLASHPSFPAFEHLRAYFAAATVGTTICRRDTGWNRLLESRPLAYLASVSYALYVFHPLTTHGWFDSGSKLAKYSKRPLSLVLSLLMAHLSTFHFEKHWIALGKKLTSRKQPWRRDARAIAGISQTSSVLG